VGQTITLASGATLTVNADGSFVFVPAGNSAYTDSFTFTISDGVTTSTATATINVGNRAPTAQNITYQVVHDHTLTANTNGLLAFNSDQDGDALSLIAINGVATYVGQTITLASGATLTVNADGTFTFVPAGGSAYTDSLDRTSSEEAESSAATVTINVTNR